MRIEGSLTKWNDDRGYGFITPTQGGPEIFVHISAFPRNTSRPLVGERLSFEIEIDKQGKKSAKNLALLSRKTTPKKHSTTYRKDSRSPIPFASVLKIGLLIALGIYIYKHTNLLSNLAGVSADTNTSIQPSNQIISNTFKCDGRTYCSQMTSCAEAKYFLKNCPNTEMDGNNDGEPCEKQWCTSAFAP